MPATTSDLAARVRVLRSPVLLTAFAVAVLILFAGVSVASASDSLSLGSTGSAVKKLQGKLHVKPVSGYFGQETRRAVIRFQRSHGLKADGVAGPATLRKLGVRASGASYATGGSAPSSGGGSSSSGSSSGSGGGGSHVKLPPELKKIAQCESGGNPRAISRSGRYRGKFQFDQATWEAAGGHGDPAAAPETTQDRIALKLYRKRGTAPWPNCA
jgi:peptidoglycan hydrolase-like protein with peptidoglycan-binding domain